MLSIPNNARLFLCKKPVNMNKSFEGLGTIVEELFPGEILSGAFFIFLNKRRDLIKVLFWEGDGFVIWYKRLEKGSFTTQTIDQIGLDRKTFFLLLEGIVPKRIQNRFSL